MPYPQTTWQYMSWLKRCSVQAWLRAIVLATNVYRKFNAGWLMIEHHASLMQSLVMAKRCNRQVDSRTGITF